MWKPEPRFSWPWSPSVPLDAVSHPILERAAVGKISFRHNLPAVIIPEAAFGLLAIYIYSKYLLNNHGVQDSRFVPWGLEGEEERTALALGR